MQTQKNNPLHGITLKMMVEELVEKYDWEYLDDKFRMNCFYENPSVSSTLKFLRKTPWARKKIEDFYYFTFYTKDGVRK